MRLLTAFLVLGLFLEPEPPNVRRMTVTIDDLPVGPPGIHANPEQRHITEELIAALTRHDVPAIGFVNEDRLERGGAVDPDRVALLERWLDAGFELGNHGYRHLDLHRVGVEEWEEHVLLGERVLGPLHEARGLRLRFFRHPFLHTGLNLEVRDRSVAFLRRHGYQVAPVTIDNQEWIFGGAYARADATLRARLGPAYVDYMKSVIAFYEQQSEMLTGGPIPHVLLVHAYALNADWLDALLTWLLERGYEFIPLEETLEHPVYSSEDRFAGRQGLTWLHRWAITRGVDPKAFAGEPAVPEWVERLTR